MEMSLDNSYHEDALKNLEMKKMMTSIKIEDLSKVSEEV